MRIFGVILQNDTKQQLNDEQWDIELSYVHVVFVHSAEKNACGLWTLATAKVKWAAR